MDLQEAETRPNSSADDLLTVTHLLSQQMGESMRFALAEMRAASENNRVNLGVERTGLYARLIECVERAERNRDARSNHPRSVSSPNRLIASVSTAAGVFRMLTIVLLSMLVGTLLGFYLMWPNAYAAGRVAGYSGAALWEKAHPGQWQDFAKKTLSAHR